MSNFFEKLTNAGANIELVLGPTFFGMILGAIGYATTPLVVGIPLAAFLTLLGLIIGVYMADSVKESDMSATTFLAYQMHNAEADRIGKMQDENGNWVPNPDYVPRGWHDDRGQWIDNPAYLEKQKQL